MTLSLQGLPPEKPDALAGATRKELDAEAQKETEIGPMPESWEATPVASLAEVKGGKRMPKGVALTIENTGRP